VFIATKAGIQELPAFCVLGPRLHGDDRRSHSFPIFTRSHRYPQALAVCSHRPHFLDFPPNKDIPGATLLIRGRHLEASCLAERVRRLRRGSQPSPREASGHRPRQLCGAAFNGWTWADERWRKPAGSWRKPVRPRKHGPERQKSPRWSAERRARRSQDARRARKRGVVGAPLGAPLPRALARRKRKTGAPRRLTKTRADDAWLFFFPLPIERGWRTKCAG
jgi:hypothetical protein